ncbi:MAG: right-handed parallel beta-helix repeat-containing protein [Ignavibacteriaceae bacterium]|jgi:hypothetical protein
MKFSITRWFFFFVFHISFLSAQVPYLDRYDGIPIIAHTNKKSSEISNENLLKMKELGIYGFYATDLDLTNYNRIKTQGLKMFPLQIWTANPWVVYYTDAVYTKWEAEGKGNGLNGDMELKHNTSIGIPFTEGNTSGIVTNSASSDKLIYGPGYYQYVTYKELPVSGNDPIRYRANYRLKVKRIDAIALPAEYLDSAVCKLQIVASNPANSSETTIQEMTLSVRNFLENGGGWDVWETKSFFPYTLASLVNINQTEHLTPSGNQNLISLELTTQYMQYKVVWQGRTFLKLYVDYIEIYDSKANELITSPTVRTNIASLVSQYADTSGVLGWFGLNEPSSIDNYEPFRIVDSLVQSVNPNLHLYTTFTTGYTAAYGGQYPGFMEGNGSVYPGTEFIKRSKLKYLSLNTYMYDYPYSLGEESYRERNIALVTNLNLTQLRIDGAPIPLSHSTQSGKFCNILGSYVPSNTQMNYHINLGLLFGMKELTCDPFFTLTLNNSPYREGLVNFESTPPTLTPLGQFWKDIIKPRMSGLVGKTIKTLTPTSQYYEKDLASTSIINNTFLNKLEKNPTNLSGAFIVDLGFFSNPTDLNKKYFIVVNRYYSECENLRFYFQNLNDFKNWEITNLVTNTKTTIVTNTANEAEHTDVIPIGDAGLYSVLPVVKYGGTLAASETISGSLQMGGNIIVPTGFTLTLAANSVINPNGFSIVSTGGTITIQSGATVNGAILKTGSTVKAIYPTMLAALSAAVSGQTVSVSGAQTVSSNLTVQSGVTLSINSGATVSFSAGKKISVYGNLTANGATFMGNGSKGYWHSLSFFANSSGTIQSSTIKDAQCGIYTTTNANVIISNNTITNNSLYGISSLSNSTINVSNCTISNNGIGINTYSTLATITGSSILNNTNYGIKSDNIGYNSDLYWHDNTLHGNGYAIVLNNASPWIGNCDLSDNTHGVVVNSSMTSFAVIPEENLNMRGYNTITCSATPLFRADNYSTVYMGYDSDGGYNSIFGSELPDMEAKNHSKIWADNNYWGSSQPAVYADGTSSIFARTPLPSDPNEGSCSNYSMASKEVIKSPVLKKMSSSALGDNYSKYGDAITNGRKGNFQKAKGTLLSIIEGEFDNKYSPLALITFYEFTLNEKRIKNKSGEVDSLNTDLNDILEKVIKRAKEDSLRPFALRLLAREAALSNNSLEMLSYNKELVANYPNSSNELSALFDLITYYTDIEQDVAKTDEFYARMVKAFPNEDLTKFAGINLGKNKGMLKKGTLGSEDKIPTEYSLSNAYPNPFNPITTITYQIPKAGFVTLEVFDILGNKVSTLVNQQKEIGKYTAQFDASSLASGTYVYQLRVNDYTSTKKMMLVK